MKINKNIMNLGEIFESNYDEIKFEQGNGFHDNEINVMTKQRFIEVVNKLFGKDAKQYELLEGTGHSYSGIADIVHNDPDKIFDLIFQIDDQYNELINKQKQLEKKLNKVKSLRSIIVSDFIYVHKALKLHDKPLSFIKEAAYTEINVLSENKHHINYEKTHITVTPLVS